MKTLNITFSERDFSKIRKVKELSNARNWKEFIIRLCQISAEENLRK